MAYELPDLPYDEAALEPHIDAETMSIHREKHHGTYVARVNEALAGTEWEDRPIEEVLRELDRIPEDIRRAVRNNGGGHANHSLFWPSMSPEGGGEPQGPLAGAIERAFGSFDEFRRRFSAAATGVFGSGWAWLVVDGASLAIETTPNQDTPLMAGKVPILGLDVWEHAYYLRYRNRRPEYVEAWWNVVNWPAVGGRLPR